MRLKRAQLIAAAVPQKLAEKKLDPESGLPHRLQQGCFARPEFQLDALERRLGFSDRPHGFLARACGYWRMEMARSAGGAPGEHPIAGAGAPIPFGPLALKRSFAEYGDEELLAAACVHPGGAARRACDVLKRARVRGPLLRECVTSGRVSSAQVCAETQSAPLLVAIIAALPEGQAHDSEEYC